MAYDEISKSSLIVSNYSFKSNLVEIGGSVLNSDAVNPFVRSTYNQGHAYIGGFSYAFASDFSELEKSNPEILKPKFYSNIYHSEFTDPKSYPYLNRLSISN